MSVDGKLLKENRLHSTDLQAVTERKTDGAAFDGQKFQKMKLPKDSVGQRLAIFLSSVKLVFIVLV